MLLKKGSIGSEVGVIQNDLKMLGFYSCTIDCIFGDETENSVNRFQSSYELDIDGIVGNNTWLKLTTEIQDIQIALNNNGFNLIVDGIAGINTYNCLLKFQKSNNIVVDGIVGPITCSNLFSSQILFTSKSKIYDISSKGIDFIADYECFYTEPYRGLDSQNQTIGYGHVIMKGESFTKLTEQEGKDLLKKDLSSFVHLVNTLIFEILLSQNQFDALVSFAYNCGVTALKNSTLLKDIKKGVTDEIIKEDFLMWCNCNGKRALGLYRRRYDEFEMYVYANYTRTYRNF